MAKITSFEDSFYYPIGFDGLEELIRFPDGEFKSEKIPNSTIWVFPEEDHQFVPKIHGGDIGCGMATFILNNVDPKGAADTIFTYLHKANILGRGNHFVDILDPISGFDMGSDSKLLLIHTHGPNHYDPKGVDEAISYQQQASNLRIDIGSTLASMVSNDHELMVDSPHNTIERNEGKVIYRKGVVKAKPGEIHPLPAHLGAKVWWYTTTNDVAPPFSSMPHATGRKGPRSETKVTVEKAREIRDLVYIPEGISDASLRTEHPSCFNGYEKITKKMLEENNLFVPVGSSRILSYVGKV